MIPHVMGAGGVIRMKGEMDRNGRGGVVVLMVNVERKWKWKMKEE